jgi:hypothetical protein
MNVYTEGNKNVMKTKTCKESPAERYLQAKKEGTLQHGAGRSSLPLQGVGNTSKPVDEKEATWSRDSGM